MSQKLCAKSASAKTDKKEARENTPTQSRGRATQPLPAQPRDSFQVVIQCESEAEQEQLYQEFRSRNFTVKLLTM